MEQVSFENGRGLKLAGSFRETDSDAGIVLSHGFTGDRHEWGYFDMVAETLHGAGYNVLAFDFSGSGESNSSPVSARRELEDLEAAIEYTRSRDVDRLGLYGHSLGGYVSLENNRQDVEAMVLTSPVTGALDLSEGKKTWGFFARLLGKVPSLNYLRKRRQLMWIDPGIADEIGSVDRQELLSGVKCPVLLIHGTGDEVVPLEASREAVEELENAELKTVEGLSHSYSSNLDEVIGAAENWFMNHLPP